MRHLALSLIGTTLLFSEPVAHSLSFQGYTGLINTPNAQVMNEGDLSFSFNNQFDNHLRNYDYSRPKEYAEDYVFGVGLLPNLEIQGRFKEQKGYARDLSANIKFKLPRIIDSDLFPDIAIGAQDLGSEANNYENYYIVADENIWIFRASVGYGYSHARSQVAPRMDGVFGGLEAQVMPWLALLGEYDGEEKHVGARLFMPKEWLNGMDFHLTVASNLDDDRDMSVMFNAIFPLGKHEKYGIGSGKEMEDAVSIATSDQSSHAEKGNHGESEEQASLKALAETLGKDGLQNVTVGTQGQTLYVAYENIVYLHNELDAIAAVLREAVAFSDRYERFVIEVKHSNIAAFTLSGSLAKAAAFYAHPSYQTKVAFQHSLHKEEGSTERWDYAVRDLNAGKFRPRIELTPLLTTFVGTDVGAFDYQLLLGVRGYLNLYKGVDLTVRGDIRIANSDNLDPVYGIYGGSYSDGGLYSAMLNYSVRIGEGINTLSMGSYDFDYVGAFDQYMYHSGNHSFKVKLGYFQDYDDSDNTKEVYLAKYAYHFTPLDIFAEVEGGKYWYQDTGFSVAFKRYFRDVAVELKYLQTTDDGDFFQSEDTNKYVGISIELPLDFRKSKLSGKYAQLNGDTSWKYGLRTTVGRKDGTNAIVPNSGCNPVLEMESEKYFYNRNRLSVGYVKENVERLLEVF
jgi:hypothetical protein